MQLDSNNLNRAFQILDSLTESYTPDLAKNELQRRLALTEREAYGIISQWRGTPRTEKTLLAE